MCFMKTIFFLIGKLIGMDASTIKLASDINIEHLWHPVEFVGIGSIDWAIDNVVHRAMKAYIDWRIVVKEAAIVENAETRIEPVIDIAMNDLSDISLFSDISMLSDGTFPPRHFVIVEEALHQEERRPAVLASYNLVNWEQMVAQMDDQDHDFKTIPSKFPAVQFALLTELETVRKHFSDFKAYVLREESNYRSALAYLIRVDLWAHNPDEITPLQQAEGVDNVFLLGRLNVALNEATSIKGKASALKEIADLLPLDLLPAANVAILQEFSQMSLETQTGSEIMRLHAEVDELMNRELYGNLDANFARMYAVKERLCLAMTKNLL